MSETLFFVSFSFSIYSKQGLFIFIINCLRPRRTLEMWIYPLLRCNRKSSQLSQAIRNNGETNSENSEQKQINNLYKSSQM